MAQIDLIPALIAAGASLTGEIDIGPKTLAGIVMPAAWTAANVTFQVSFDGGATWLEHISYPGNATSFTVAAGQYLAVDPVLWRGVTALKIRSGTLAVPVNQAAAAALQCVTRWIA